MGQYDFSVVMAVYNVENYLRDAVESLVHQTIGFSHIQLIMVDDGSTDSSGKICDEYKKKYPENVVVIHKENGGVASARNAGLPFADGNYLNFMDSDDKFERGAFKQVYQFFTKHETETDICTVPITFFEAYQGPHWQNGKFERGSRIIDLSVEYNATLMFVNASFFKGSLRDQIQFDGHLVCGEDIKVIMEILIDKMSMGVVSGEGYLYRRRLGENASLIQSAKKKKGWYDDYFTYLVDWCTDLYMTKFGYLPGFVQYELMSDLQWRFAEDYETDMISTLDGNQAQINSYYKRLISSIQHIDDKYILEMKMVRDEHKYYILELKNHGQTVLEKTDHDLLFRIGENSSLKMSETRTELELLSCDGNEWTIEGYHIIYGNLNFPILPYLSVNKQMIPCEIIERNKPIKSLGNVIAKTVGFSGKIPQESSKLRIHLAIKADDTWIIRNKITFGACFPLSDVYKNSCFYIENKMLVFQNSGLTILQRPGWMKRTIRECLLLQEIWHKNLLGGRKAVPGRLFYHCVMPFKHKKLWIISDRIMAAGDNGEVLFDYIMRNKPRDTKVLFAISRQSKDYTRVSKIGPCIEAMSFKHKLLHLISDMVISSHADGTTRNPFLGHHDALRDLLYQQKYVFLQHGIIKDDLSSWLNKYNENIDGFVTSAKPEWESIALNTDYHYEKERIWLTGLPRYDWLYHDEKKLITVMPTWRRYLMYCSDDKKGTWVMRDGFEKQPFFTFYSSLMTSERLVLGLAKYGYTLQFFPHPNIQPYAELFQHDRRIKILNSETRYRKVFAESELIITDYSSVAFDFSYLRKPVIYCQFDHDEFFGGRHVYTEGYFDYLEDGFGEVAVSLEQTVDLILEYASGGCVLKDKYRKRIDDFFEFHDTDNCKRVMDKINMLESS